MAEQPKFHHEGTKHTKKSETKKFVDSIPGNWIQERKKRVTPLGSVLTGEGGVFFNVAQYLDSIEGYPDDLSSCLVPSW